MLVDHFPWVSTVGLEMSVMHLMAVLLFSVFLFEPIHVIIFLPYFSTSIISLLLL